jgi:invasion protein IalB
MRNSNFLSAALAATLIYSPWTKECPKGKRGGGCVLTSEARRENGDFVASAVVVEEEGGALPVLRVGLPLGVLLFKSVSAAVDKDPAVAGTYTVCLPSGCLADIEPSADLLDKLKKGRAIALRWSGADGSDAACVVPLDGFAEALSGPPATPKPSP